MAIGLWLFTNKTKLGKIARAAAVDREMVGAVGINVSWVFAFAFVFGCFMAGLGGALMATTISITLGMDHNIIIDGFLIVTIGGLGNMWGALVGSLIFGLTQAFGVLFWPQFAIVFPYTAVVIVLILRPRGILKSVGKEVSTLLKAGSLKSLLPAAVVLVILLILPPILSA